MWSRSWRIGLLALAAVLVWGPALAAEHEGEKAEPMYMIVHMDQVYPEKAMEYEENARAWVAAAKEAGLGEQWTWWASSGPGFSYAYVSALPDFATLDRWEEREKEFMTAVGEEKIAELLKGQSFVRTQHRELLKSRRELSYRTKTTFVPGHIQVSTYWIRPDMTAQWEDLVKRVKEAYEKAEHPLGWEIYQVLFGEGSYVVTTMAESPEHFWSQPDVPEVLAETLGEEATQAIFEDYAACVVDEHTGGYRTRDDMSFMPAMYAMMEKMEQKEQMQQMEKDEGN